MTKNGNMPTWRSRFCAIASLAYSYLDQELYQIMKGWCSGDSQL